MALSKGELVDRAGHARSIPERWLYQTRHVAAFTRKPCRWNSSHLASLLPAKGMSIWALADSEYTERERSPQALSSANLPRRTPTMRVRPLNPPSPSGRDRVFGEQVIDVCTADDESPVGEGRGRERRPTSTPDGSRHKTNRVPPHVADLMGKRRCRIHLINRLAPVWMCGSPTSALSSR